MIVHTDPFHFSFTDESISIQRKSGRRMAARFTLYMDAYFSGGTGGFFR